MAGGVRGGGLEQGGFEGGCEEVGVVGVLVEQGAGGGGSALAQAVYVVTVCAVVD